MNTKTTEGGAPAPVETDAVKALETVESESEQKSEGEIEADKAKTETEGDAKEGEAEKVETEAEGDDQEPEEKPETKQQRKRRIRREREDAAQHALANSERELQAIKKRLARYEDVDPDKADNYDAATAQNVVNKTLRAQEQARLEEVEAERERLTKQAENERAETWREKVAELTHIKDFYQKVHEDKSLPFSPPLVEMIADMDRGPEVAYYLATNKHELQRLAEMPPTRAAIELGKIEAGLALPKPKVKSTAPPPIKSLKGSMAEAEPDLSKMDFNSYRKARLGF